MDVLPLPQIHGFFPPEKPKPTQVYNQHSCHVLRKSKTKSTAEFSLAAHQSFDEIPLSDTFAWNNLIQTHLTTGHSHLALSTYHQMLLRGVRPDRHTLPRVLAASRLSRHLFLAKQLHAHALKLGFSHDQYVLTALLQIYAHLDNVDTAKWLLVKSPPKDSVSWTLLARLYIRKEKPALAIDLFHQMLGLGAQIDSVALATAIGASATLKSLKRGKNLHQIARKCELEFDMLVGNSLLKMYIDCCSIQDARATFDRMPSKDVISWTTIIRAYVKKGGYNEGLKLFRQMIMNGLKPDPVSISSLLPACARITAGKQGKEIHGYLLKNGIDLNVAVLNAVMDMYVKSGCIKSASRMFQRLKYKDVVSWTVMIMGYSSYGRGELGVDLFREMEKESSTQIDEITYAAVLHACTTARKVEDGKLYFNCINPPKVAHCALKVALLATSGMFDEAMLFIQEQNIERHAEVHRALLDGCRIHQNKKLGKRVIEQLCELEPLNAENYVLLSNWYADNSRWDMVNKVKGTIRDMGLKPKKAYSWIELRNKVHVFGTGDVSHPRSERIYWELQCLMKKMEDEGHKPSPDYSLHDVDEERECVEFGHSEMLALSFGLISTQAGSTIRVTKNLRVCRFCHESAKVISRMVGREIIFKDPNLFHHFHNGLCSCSGFW
ncbi:DYW domain containing protein [Trema orientale]|uniref:DYW domain containing protein n=1 Tax=Trema orientale TaxID=63057 RepID=A0A2P5F1U5_TREOI|nr:DYW domain containing protein [Trema orientale]